MNKKVIAIFILTMVALVVLWAYSFGPLSQTRVTEANPTSLQPIPEQTVVAENKVKFNVYHNKDLIENFYTIRFPQTWQIQSQKPVGSYHFTFPHGSASAELIDVPDNSTLELFVLTQQEPQLKKGVIGYSRISYHRISVNGNDAYQFIYHSNVNGEDVETVRTYITGQDQASVITLAVKQNDFATMQPLFLAIVNSFQWENK